MLAENWDKAGRRLSSAVHAYIGPNGSGKTLAAVHDVMLSLEDGRKVLSSVPLLDWTADCTTCGNARCSKECSRAVRPPHPLWVPFESLEQLLDWRDGDVLMDEVQGIASAREHQGLPYQVANVLRKLRHADARLLWTAPDWMAADAVIRRVSRAVTLCHGHMAVQHISPCSECGARHRRPVEGCSLTGRTRLWDDNRLVSWRTFDATAFEEFNVNRAQQTAQKGNRLKAQVKQMYWRPGGVAQYAYDTYGEVLSLGGADMAGVCVACGGVKRRKPCSCPDSTGTAPVGLRDLLPALDADGGGAGGPRPQRGARGRGEATRRPREARTGRGAA